MKKICLALAMIALVTSPSAAQVRTEAGTLVCRMGASLGLVVTSTQRMSCVFVSKTGTEEFYEADFRRVGLDLGITAGGQMTWIVYSASRELAPRALAGNYVGVSGDVALGLGVGANALVGGSRHTITLQPVSVETGRGLNLALGAARFRLR